MPIYSIDVRIYATAYIRAESEAAAMEEAKRLKLMSLHVAADSDVENYVEISGADYNSPDLPDVSLSPAMTIHGPDDGDTPEQVAD